MQSQCRGAPLPLSPFLKRTAGFGERKVWFGAESSQGEKSERLLREYSVDREGLSS